MSRYRWVWRKLLPPVADVVIGWLLSLVGLLNATTVITLVTILVAWFAWDKIGTKRDRSEFTELQCTRYLSGIAIIFVLILSIVWTEFTVRHWANSDATPSNPSLRIKISEVEKGEGILLSDDTIACYWKVVARFGNESETHAIKIDRVTLVVERLGQTFELDPLDDVMRQTFKTNDSLSSGGYLTFKDEQIQPSQYHKSNRLLFLDSQAALSNLNRITLRVIVNGKTEEVYFGDF